MKKLFLIFVTLFFAVSTFAQNVKPYTVDLSKLPAVSENKSAAFEKKTGTISFKGENSGIYIAFERQNISDYNIAKIKYKAVDGYGFFLTLDYDDDTLEWNNKTTYCPSYINEMIIPFPSDQKIIKGLYFAAAWHVPSEKITVESITFEKVANPQKTDLYASSEPPVIDTAASGNIDDKISAWDYVKKLGVGFQYYPFANHDVNTSFDLGTDIYVEGAFSKPRKELIQFIKNKGFKTLRLQTAPEFFSLDGNYTISPQYMKELKEVVDWAIEEDMYVVICGSFSEWLQKDEGFRKKAEEDPRYAGVTVSEKYKEKTKALLKAVWSQYAAAFNNSYDEHLIFETLNEPIDAFHDHAWSVKTDCSVCKKDFAILNEYNQLIVDTIRASGGNNSKRFIVVEGLVGDAQNIATNLFKLPKDKIKDRLIPAYHEYTMAAGEDSKLIYTKSMKNRLAEKFKKLDKYFFNKHIPVYVNEFNLPCVTPILEKITCTKDFMAEVTNEKRSSAVLMHISPKDNDLSWAYYDEWTLEWYQTEFLDTVLYAAQGKDFPLSDDFIKANEVKYESIVGKNLLNEPFNPNNWEKLYNMISDTLINRVPSKYKLEFQVEKTGNNPILQVSFHDINWNYVDLSARTDVKVTGAVKGNNFEVKSETITLTINEKLAAELEDAAKIYFGGQDIIIKSVKVVE